MNEYDSDYARFIQSKSQYGTAQGFEPLFIPKEMMGFQQCLTEWWIRSGRGAIFAACGLGKSLMQLVAAENVVRHTNRPALILTPLAVTAQFVTEAEKFGMECFRSRDGKYPSGAKIIISNYERLHYFNTNDFSLVFADESSILKNCEGATRAAVIEFLRTMKYRGLATATPSPNDYVELGNSAEALGEMGFQDMLTTFFKKTQKGGQHAWARLEYHLRGHAVVNFWRWVCSWCRAIRRPSDLGFDDGPFVLPELITREHQIESRSVRPGFLFNIPATSLRDQQEERRRTIGERCEKAASLVNNTGKAAVAWCHLNDEGDILTSLIPDAKQVSGKNSDDEKEELLSAFANGQIRVLVTKSVLAGFGLNWQHCAHQVHFPSHSWEQFHQCIHRSHRFGQEQQVNIDIISTEGEYGVLMNLKRKAAAAELMMDRLVELMNDQLRIERSNPFTNTERSPSWLASTN